MMTNEDIAVDLDKYSIGKDLPGLFNKAGPIEIEVGSGKGTFLLNQAKAHPDINYLGMEWANKYYRLCVDRIRRWQMDNVRVLRADARDFIAGCVRDSTVKAFHIYYPDPWPKKRHHKRRFFAQKNILQVARCLQPGGELRVATDHLEYFEVISEVLLGDPTVTSIFEQIEFCPTDAADQGELVGSNFERKYIKEGRNSYKIALKKTISTLDI